MLPWNLLTDSNKWDLEHWKEIDNFLDPVVHWLIRAIPKICIIMNIIMIFDIIIYGVLPLELNWS